MIPLCYANPGEESVIRKIGGSPEVKKHLENLGFVVGGTVTVITSLNGNVISNDQGELNYHAHAAFAYKDGGEHHVAAGHVKSITISYTGEIELRPVIGGVIGMQHDPETGTGFWSFRD